MAEQQRQDLDKPRWDQSTFIGRFKHFLAVTDPTKTFYTNKQLDDAKALVEAYRQGKEPPKTTTEELWKAKHLVDSSFHPDTGDRMNVFGRMSFQLPANMLLGGALLYWYKTGPQVLFMQWLNQSYNALANYTNRNAKADVNSKQLGFAYISATTSAVAFSLLFRSLVKTAPPLLNRYVPFVGVAAANCINIPLMRQRELEAGVEVTDVDGNPLGTSRIAPVKGLTQVIISRISMAVPTLIILPSVMEKIEAYPFMKKLRPYHGWMQTLAVGLCLVVMVPAGCALFPQRCSVAQHSESGNHICHFMVELTLKRREQSSIEVDHLETELQERIRQRGGPVIDKVYFNKGL